MPADARIGLEAVRDRLRRRLDEISLRALAEEIGISRGGLESFLAGREPYSKTRVALLAWNVRQSAAGKRVSREATENAIITLAAYIAEGATPNVQRRRFQGILAALERALT